MVCAPGSREPQKPLPTVTNRHRQHSVGACFKSQPTRGTSRALRVGSEPTLVLLGQVRSGRRCRGSCRARRGTRSSARRRRPRTGSWGTRPLAPHRQDALVGTPLMPRTRHAEPANTPTLVGSVRGREVPGRTVRRGNRRMDRTIPKRGVPQGRVPQGPTVCEPPPQRHADTLCWACSRG